MFNPERPTFIQKQESSEEPKQEKPETSREIQAELISEFESGLNEDFEAVVAVINKFEEIAEEARTTEQKEKLKPIREKVARVAKRFFRMGRNLTFAGVIALGVDYYVTHHDLEIRDDGKGHIEYMHPDAETTHILNVLGGRDSVSLEEALRNFRGIIKTSADAFGVELPDDFDTYDIDKIDKFIVDALNKKGTDVKSGELKEYFYEFQYLKRVDIPEDRRQQIYNLVWEVERECGNPKIRFQTKGPSVLGIELSSEDIYRPHYDPLENTIYLPMDVFVGQSRGYQNFLAEMSHSKQLKDNPFGFYFKTTSSILRIFSKGGFDAGKLHEAQQEEYQTSGSLEHEAHSVIEPELTKKYEKITKIKGIKGKEEGK